MQLKKLMLVFSLLFSTVALAEPSELLRDVASDRNDRLIAYNQEQLNALPALRYRIVRTDPRVLKGDTFTVTPFDNVDSITVQVIKRKTRAHGAKLHGKIVYSGATSYLMTVLGELGAFASADFRITKYDVDPDDGTASHTQFNTFRHHRFWELRPNGESEFVVPAGETADVGHLGGPTIEEDRRYHRKMKRLERDKFRTVNGRILDLDNERIFMLARLQFTPKYSVVYEVDDSSSQGRMIDGNPGDGMTEKEKADFEVVKKRLLKDVKAYHARIQAAVEAGTYDPELFADRDRQRLQRKHRERPDYKAIKGEI